MPLRKPMESLSERKKNIGATTPLWRGKFKKMNLVEKSKHHYSNESNLQTKIKTHLISSALLKEVTKPKIYRNTNINNRTKTHKLVSKTRQNPNEKIHKLKQKWWGRWPWLVLGPLLKIQWMQHFFSSHPKDPYLASDEWEFEVLNERDETILGLRVIVCGSGDGGVIKLHTNSDPWWF